MGGLVNNPEYWRTRAETTRVIAKSMREGESRNTMFRIANDYEWMAQAAEERLKKKTTITGLNPQQT
jgi:hypothetical protein